MCVLMYPEGKKKISFIIFCFRFVFLNGPGLGEVPFLLPDQKTGRLWDMFFAAAVH